MLNDYQQALFHAAMSSDPPFITNDPQVNHAVDQMMEDSSIPYNKNLYCDEIEAAKKNGSLLLGYCDV